MPSANLVCGESEVTRILDGEPRRSGKGRHVALSDSEDIIDDVLRWGDVAVAVVPCELEQL